MKVYKDKQFLIFDFENGQTVKYDLAERKMIGKKGGYVKSLNCQLSNLSAREVISSCTDKQYGKFLEFVKSVVEANSCRTVSNVGTILKHVNELSKFEQFFSAGVDRVSAGLTYRISDVPAGLIKICREKGIKLEDNFLEYYKANPDAFNTAFSLEYETLTNADIYNFLMTYCSNTFTSWKRKSIFNLLIDDYGYNAKALMLYIDRLKTFEAIEGMSHLATEILDYARMMKTIGAKFDKYPRHFLTTHAIAVRNYNRLKQDFDEDAFKKCIHPEMEWTYKGYSFIYPRSTQEIKDEAVAQNNCVASYIKRVIDGECHVMFLRHKESPDRSLVTLQVTDNVIVQARRHYNYEVTAEQREAIEAWNAWNKKRVA